MPSGPAVSRRFGAFYHQLKYCEEWDAIWRAGDVNELVGGADIRELPQAEVLITA